MEKPSVITATLARIEIVGNRLPHPTELFMWLCLLILLLSWFAAGIGLRAIHPITQETIAAKNILSGEGLRLMLLHTVSNFTNFAPVGTVLIAMLGLGIADHSGLLSAALRSLVLRAPAGMLTFIVVLAGVLSSLAADSGYVVLIPLAAIIFSSAGRHPVAGIAAAFAGVSGGFSANLVIGPIDAILAGISTEAAHIVDAGYQVEATGNYYFMLVSTLLIAVIGSWVTERFVEPHLGDYNQKKPPRPVLEPTEKKALLRVLWFSITFIALMLMLVLPEDAPLRNQQSGSISTSPFMQGIVTTIAFFAALAGVIYGKTTGVFSIDNSIIDSMEKTMSTMATYLVLMFFAAQFVNYFAWTQLGTIMAIHGAQWLQSLALPASILMLLFVLFSALINLFIGSASAKWALLAPIFVPMFYLTGIAPETTQVAFRVGDSVTNIITPLMPYFALVAAFVRRYDNNAGMGTIVAVMLPYSLFFLLGWSLLLFVWMTLGWPLGPGAELTVGVF